MAAAAAASVAENADDGGIGGDGQSRGEERALAAAGSVGGIEQSPGVAIQERAFPAAGNAASNVAQSREAAIGEKGAGGVNQVSEERAVEAAGGNGRGGSAGNDEERGEETSRKRGALAAGGIEQSQEEAIRQGRALAAAAGGIEQSREEAIGQGGALAVAAAGIEQSREAIGQGGAIEQSREEAIGQGGALAAAARGIEQSRQGGDNQSQEEESREGGDLVADGVRGNGRGGSAGSVEESGEETSRKRGALAAGGIEQSREEAIGAAAIAIVDSTATDVSHELGDVPVVEGGALAAAGGGIEQSRQGGREEESGEGGALAADGVGGNGRGDNVEQTREDTSRERGGFEQGTGDESREAAADNADGRSAGGIEQSGGEVRALAAAGSTEQRREEVSRERALAAGNAGTGGRGGRGSMISFRNALLSRASGVASVRIDRAPRDLIAEQLAPQNNDLAACISLIHECIRVQHKDMGKLRRILGKETLPRRQETRRTEYQRIWGIVAPKQCRLSLIGRLWHKESIEIPQAFRGQPTAEVYERIKSSLPTFRVDNPIGIHLTNRDVCFKFGRVYVFLDGVSHTILLNISEKRSEVVLVCEYLTMHQYCVALNVLEAGHAHTHIGYVDGYP